MHPLRLLLSIIFCTILATHMLTNTIKSLRTDAAGCWMRDGTAAAGMGCAGGGQRKGAPMDWRT
jgi:hypothetical protein